jgi:hypothetical protein
MDIMQIMAQAQHIIGLVMMILSGVIGICLLIPGEHPEKELQAALDFLTKFSKK